MTPEVRDRDKLLQFVLESNRIEGIASYREMELDLHARLLEIPRDVDVLEFRNRVIAFTYGISGGNLRNCKSMDVTVGNHTPPKGGPEIVTMLDAILSNMKQYRLNPMHCYRMHHQYETVHPFMDGNGRSGRALWLWQMGGIEKAPLGFLHHWYYQSLQFGGNR